MKKLIIIFVPSFLVANICYAKSGYNASVYGGVDAKSSRVTVHDGSDKVNAKFTNNPMFGASYGYNYNGFTIDLSYENHISEFQSKLRKNQVVHAQTGLVGLTYNINNNGAFRPYIGVGVGIGQLRIKDDFNEDGDFFYKKTRASFAYQGKVGVAIGVSRKLSIFADVRFTQIIDKQLRSASSNTRFGTNYTTGVFGVTYHFDDPSIY